MIRNLLIFSGIALLVSVVCLSGAAAIAGRDAQQNGLSWNWFEENGKFHFSRSYGVSSPTETSSKTLNWSGGNRIDIALPAEVIYIQGPGSSISISGPKELVDMVAIEGDRLVLKKEAGVRKTVSFQWKDGDLNIDGAALQVTITAPSINDFSISGAGDLNLQNYNQPTLSVGVSGMGDIKATGSTETLTVSISGAGDADLEGLATRDANVNVSGKGDATIAPTGAVAINVSGMGNVKLKTKPTSLSSNVSGLGKVEQE